VALSLGTDTLAGLAGSDGFSPRSQQGSHPTPGVDRHEDLREQSVQEIAYKLLSLNDFLLSGTVLSLDGGAAPGRGRVASAGLAVLLRRPLALAVAGSRAQRRLARGDLVRAAWGGRIQ
jgi:hypothetical protein